MMPRMVLTIQEMARSDWKSAAMPFIANEE
jgi:hypothetical protein